MNRSIALLTVITAALFSGCAERGRQLVIQATVALFCSVDSSKFIKDAVSESERVPIAAYTMMSFEHNERIYGAERRAWRKVIQSYKRELVATGSAPSNFWVVSRDAGKWKSFVRSVKSEVQRTCPDTINGSQIDFALQKIRAFGTPSETDRDQRSFFNDNVR